MARALVLGLTALLLARWLVNGRIDFGRTSLDLPLLLFLGSALLSTLFAYNPNVAVFGTYTRYDGLLTTFTYLALFWLAVQGLREPANARALVMTLIVAGYVAALVAVVQSVRDSGAAGGFRPAIGTLGNANVAGAFFAMVCPLAMAELARARTWAGRLLSLNALVLVAVTLLLTLSRSAWLGLGVAALAMAVFGRGRLERYGLLVAVAVLGLGVVLAGAQTGGVTVERRLITALYPPAWGPRLHIWQDSVSVIASRPVLGYGPDNFGLVYPHFQTGKWAVDSTGFELQIDKAHAETLQVAATQGLVGLAAYLLVLFAFVLAFWRGRRREGAAGLLAAWLAYQVTLQLNFTALASAFPFWILAAAAVVIWTDPRGVTLRLGARARPLLAATAAAAVVLLAVVGVVSPYLADVQLLRAVNADFSGRRSDAAAPAEVATRLAPYESVYSVEAGNLAYEQDHWQDAAAAYARAASLGTYNPRVYRDLALADRSLGRMADALAAARQAAALDRFDPANQALVDQLQAQSS